ncbi:MAG TPA: YkvA family protein [Roseateles sp.]|uniref:YkvA family protein n=1 Tax=Roseateles sp. TaxID=1971397 RepID=UPI002ED9638D
MFKRLTLLWTVVRGDARRLWRAVRDPDAPAWLKAGTALIVLYVLSPIDLIPDFIPVLGLLDDVVLVPLAIRFLLKLTGTARSRPGAASAQRSRERSGVDEGFVGNTPGARDR